LVLYKNLVFNFIRKGLQEVHLELSKLEIQFHILEGEAVTVLPAFIKAHNIGGVVVDFSPLRTHTSWVESLKKKLPADIPLCQVIVVA
jgi:deoxyribodipyrimidine photo-lyase